MLCIDCWAGEYGAAAALPWPRVNHSFSCCHCFSPTDMGVQFRAKAETMSCKGYKGITHTRSPQKVNASQV